MRIIALEEEFVTEALMSEMPPFISTRISLCLASWSPTSRAARSSGKGHSSTK